MKKIYLIAFVALSAVIASCGGTKSEPAAPIVPATPLTGEAKLTVDPAASTLGWEGEMLGLYSHNGNIAVQNGSIELKDGKVVSGTFTIDMKNIKPLDANYTVDDGHTAENLVGHLSSPDFFDVATYPTATFTITAVNGNTIDGNLTVRGKTNAEKIEVSSIALEGDNVRIKGKTTFNRQNYGVAFAMPVKDKVLSDEIELNIDLVAKKS